MNPGRAVQTLSSAAGSTSRRRSPSAWRRHLGATASLALLAAGCQAQTWPVQAAVADDPVMATRWTCPAGSLQLAVSSNGVVELQRQGSPTRRVALTQAPGKPDVAQIEMLWCASYRGDVLLQLQGRYAGDAAGGELVRLDPDAAAVRWRTWLGGNSSAPLLRGDRAYVTGHGRVAKVDLATGKLLWDHAGLARREGMNTSFATPRVEGDRVTFPAEHSFPERALREGWPKAVVVSDQRGTILEGVL